MVLSVVLALGEGSALHVLASDDLWLGWKWLVGSCMFLGGVGVIAPLVILQYNVIARGAHLKRLRLATNVVKAAAIFLVSAVGGAIAAWAVSSLVSRLF
jgi:hypothetical protein